MHNEFRRVEQMRWSQGWRRNPHSPDKLVQCLPQWQLNRNHVIPPPPTYIVIMASRLPLRTTLFLQIIIVAYLDKSMTLAFEVAILCASSFSLEKQISFCSLLTLDLFLSKLPTFSPAVAIYPFLPSSPFFLRNSSVNVHNCALCPAF
jgi:hypothetical protein